MTCCKVLSLCEEVCACHEDGLAKQIKKPVFDGAGLVREVPELRDDCGCLSRCDCDDVASGILKPKASSEKLLLVDLAGNEICELEEW